MAVYDDRRRVPWQLTGHCEIGRAECIVELCSARNWCGQGSVAVVAVGRPSARARASYIMAPPALSCAAPGSCRSRAPA